MINACEYITSRDGEAMATERRRPANLPGLAGTVVLRRGDMPWFETEVSEVWWLDVGRFRSAAAGSVVLYENDLIVLIERLKDAKMKISEAVDAYQKDQTIFSIPSDPFASPPFITVYTGAPSAFLEIRFETTTTDGRANVYAHSLIRTISLNELNFLIEQLEGLPSVAREMQAEMHAAYGAPKAYSVPPMIGCILVLSGVFLGGFFLIALVLKVVSFIFGIGY